jgi:hypothetical protein
MATDLTDGRTFCANHPDRETSLRCNRCGKYICTKCAVRMATGYRCKECVNQQQQIFETALWYDYVVAGVIAALLAGLAGLLVTRLVWFTFFLSPVAGGAIAEVIFRAVRKRRGKYLPWAAVAGVLVGGLPLCGLPLTLTIASLFLGSGEGGAGGIGLLLGSIWPLVYVALCASTVYYRLRGIRIN